MKSVQLAGYKAPHFGYSVPGQVATIPLNRPPRKTRPPPPSASSSARATTPSSSGEHSRAFWPSTTPTSR